MDERVRLQLIVDECDRVLARLPADEPTLRNVREAVETTRRVALERLAALGEETAG